MSWFKRWREIRRLKKQEREALHWMMQADALGLYKCERIQEQKVDEIRARIDELKAVKR